MGRRPRRPAYLHFMIKALGYETPVTPMFRKGDLYLDSDAVSGVRESRVGDWLPQPGGGHTLDFDFVANPGK